MELRSDLEYQQCGQKHAHACLRNLLCRIAREEPELRCEDAVEYCQQDGNSCLNSAYEGYDDFGRAAHGNVMGLEVSGDERMVSEMKDDTKPVMWEPR